MSSPASMDASRSLLSVTFHRATVTSRFYLLYGTGFSIFLGVVLAISGGNAYSSAYPLFVPIFAVVGSMGSLVVFTNDRTKGVLEYLLAYGYSPRELFANVLLTTVLLASIVLGVGVSASLGIYLALGHSLTGAIAIGLGVYAVPMGYACGAFATTVGVYWTALSSPREGLNSPIGLIPFVGLLPALVTLFAVILIGLGGDTSTATFLKVFTVALVLIWAFVLSLLARIGTLLRRERMLSPA